MRGTLEKRICIYTIVESGGSGSAICSNQIIYHQPKSAKEWNLFIYSMILCIPIAAPGASEDLIGGWAG